MLIKVKTLKGFKQNCKDVQIGKTKNFYFDDNYWTIKYLVADTGNWLFGNQVLISPQPLKSADKGEEYINVDLTKKQIEDSPPIINEAVSPSVMRGNSTISYPSSKKSIPAKSISGSEGAPSPATSSVTSVGAAAVCTAS